MLLVQCVASPICSEVFDFMAEKQNTIYKKKIYETNYTNSMFK